MREFPCSARDLMLHEAIVKAIGVHLIMESPEEKLYPLPERFRRTIMEKRHEIAEEFARHNPDIGFLAADTFDMSDYSDDNFWVRAARGIVPANTVGHVAVLCLAGGMADSDDIDHVLGLLIDYSISANRLVRLLSDEDDLVITGTYLIGAEHKTASAIDMARLPADLATMPYSDYLQTEHWKVARAAALDRADHRCQVCNIDQRLEVHHRTYERRGEELPSDLTVLCADCHGRFHEPRNGKVTRMPATTGKRHR